jgi:hypothetical protein
MAYRFKKTGKKPTPKILQDAALKQVMLALRGGFEPAKFIVDRLNTGDRISYELSKKARGHVK